MGHLYIEGVIYMQAKQRALFQWYGSPVGHQVAALERRILQPVVDTFRPYRTLELANAPLIDSTNVKESFCVGLDFPKLSLNKIKYVIGDFHCLPFASESFDLVVCSHLFETTPYAGGVIAEISRVLAPEGLLIMTGFNPGGLWRKSDYFSTFSWWSYPHSPCELVALSNLCALDEMYVDYCGYLGCSEQRPGSVSKQVSEAFGKLLPGSSVLYKVVLRKRVSARASAMIDEVAMLQNMHAG